MTIYKYCIAIIKKQDWNQLMQSSHLPTYTIHLYDDIKHIYNNAISMKNKRMSHTLILKKNKIKHLKKVRHKGQ